MTGPCIGYLPTGNLCRRPAEIIDEEAGGFLCDECAAAKRRRQDGHRADDLTTTTVGPRRAQATGRRTE